MPQPRVDTSAARAARPRRRTSSREWCLSGRPDTGLAPARRSHAWRTRVTLDFSHVREIGVRMAKHCARSCHPVNTHFRPE